MTPKILSMSAILFASTLGATAQDKDPFAPPTRSQDQGFIYRNAIPQGFETHIIVNNDADRARAERIIEFYEVLATRPSIESVGEYVSDQYIQHSTMLPNGASLWRCCSKVRSMNTPSQSTCTK